MSDIQTCEVEEGAPSGGSQLKQSTNTERKESDEEVIELRVHGSSWVLETERRIFEDLEIGIRRGWTRFAVSIYIERVGVLGGIGLQERLIEFAAQKRSELNSKQSNRRRAMAPVSREVGSVHSKRRPTPSRGGAT